MADERMSRQELIESRINTDLAGNMPMSSLGVVFRQMGEVMEFAKMMAVSGPAVPPVFRNNPGACLAVAIKAHHLGFEPFSFASKCYFVNDQLAYESQLINAIIIRRGPFVKRPTIDYTGDAATRQCIVTLHFAEPDGDMTYVSPPIGTITTKNSPLWKADPDQQLAYYAVRAAARRYCPDVIMGMYDQEEMASIAAKDVTPIKPTVDIGAKLAASAAPQATYDKPAEPAEAVPAITLPETPTEPASEPAAGPVGPSDTTGADTHAGVKFDWALTAELEEALKECTTVVEVQVLADEFDGAIMAASPQSRAAMQLMLSVRKGEFEV